MCVLYDFLPISTFEITFYTCFIPLLFFIYIKMSFSAFAFFAFSVKAQGNKQCVLSAAMGLVIRFFHTFWGDWMDRILILFDATSIMRFGISHKSIDWCDHLSEKLRVLFFPWLDFSESRLTQNPRNLRTFQIKEDFRIRTTLRWKSRAIFRFHEIKLNEKFAEIVCGIF
jgi:hypothetical protein